LRAALALRHGLARGALCLCQCHGLALGEHHAHRLAHCQRHLLLEPRHLPLPGLILHGALLVMQPLLLLTPLPRRARLLARLARLLSRLARLPARLLYLLLHHREVLGDHALDRGQFAANGPLEPAGQAALALIPAAAAAVLRRWYDINALRQRLAAREHPVAPGWGRGRHYDLGRANYGPIPITPMLKLDETTVCFSHATQHTLALLLMRLC